jgi:hypothetical protein
MFKAVLRIAGLLALCSFVFYLGWYAGSDMKDCRPAWLDKTQDLTNNIPDMIPEQNIHIFPGKLVLEGDYQLSSFADSNSMLPVLDSGSSGIEVPVYADTILERGNIISYKLEGRNYTVVHRIIDIQEDAKGIYYTTQGDYLQEPDPYKVRQDQVQRLMIGVIW